MQQEQDNNIVLEECKALRKEISKQDAMIVELTAKLEDQEEKYKSLLKEFLGDKEQEETKDVEPEPTTLSEKEIRFLKLVNKYHLGE